MALTLGQLETEVVRLQGLIDLLPTREDITTLTALINARHTTLMTTLSDLESRVQKLEDAFLAHVGNTTLHNPLG